MTQQRQTKMVVSKFGDTRWTKVFVGGLAWETHSDTIRAYFQQFGHILEAVVIFDKVTSKSKGYGFVTFKNPDSAMRACQDPYPVIDGRRANCNLASFGQGTEQIRRQVPTPGSPVPGGSMYYYYYHPFPQSAFSHSTYGYPTYTQDIYAMNYYNNAYGGQHYPYYYGAYTPFYAQSGPNKYIQHQKLAENPQSVPSADEAVSGSEQKSSSG